MNSLSEITVLMFDPAFGTTGWAVGKIKNGILTITHYGELHLTKDAKKYEDKALYERFGIRLITAKLLQQVISEMITKYKIDVICVENTYHYKFINAFKALSYWITVLELQSMEHNIKVYKIPTRSIKQLLTTYGGASKLQIQEAVRHHDNIKFSKRCKVMKLSEHVCDAIGVGYYFMLKIFPVLNSKLEEINV